MTVTKEMILEAVNNMSVIELNDLVKAFEERYGVSATSVTSNSPAQDKIEKVEEKTEFTVILTDIGINKVSVIKTVREITGLGLKEAKSLVDSAPKPIKENIDKTSAEDIKKKLESSGAKVELK